MKIEPAGFPRRAPVSPTLPNWLNATIGGSDEAVKGWKCAVWGVLWKSGGEWRVPSGEDTSLETPV
jgi:hypothetical protein